MKGLLGYSGSGQHLESILGPLKQLLRKMGFWSFYKIREGA